MTKPHLAQFEHFQYRVCMRNTDTLLEDTEELKTILKIDFWNILTDNWQGKKIIQILTLKYWWQLNHQSEHFLHFFTH